MAIRASSRRRRILVVGRDARTDALAEACAASSADVELIAYSDCAIPGLLQKATHLEVGDLTDTAAITRLAADWNADLVVVGPVEPLVAGLADNLEVERGIRCFGPTKAQARVESSKAWTRQLLDNYDIPGNPRYAVVDDTSDIARVVHKLQEVVVKPDGLTGGKGVRVMGEHLATAEDAVNYAGSLVASSGRAIIEERLEGEEFSLQTITDGVVAVHCPAVRDHKRAFEGDTGPNTGGMGSYSFPDGSLPYLRAHDLAEARSINESVIDALRHEVGLPYRGVLYGGFMATAEGIRLIEYNARFGDPEVLNTLPLLRSDFVELCDQVVAGRLDSSLHAFDSKATVCTYVVPEGYPDSCEGGHVSIPEAMSGDSQVRYYWAATNQVGDRIELTTSRAVAVVGIGDSVEQAVKLAERGASGVIGDVRFRRDIASPSSLQASIGHMMKLRAGRD